MIEVADTGIGIPGGTAPPAVQGIRTVRHRADRHRRNRPRAGDCPPARPTDGRTYGPPRQPGRRQRVLAGAAGRRPLTSPAGGCPGRGHPGRAALNVLVTDDSEVNRKVAVGVPAQGGPHGNRGARWQRGGPARRNRRLRRGAHGHAHGGMDGLEATRRIRALGGSRGQVPIVAVTANALDQHAEECRRAGMSEHLAKPFTQAELLAVVARAAGDGPRPDRGDGDRAGQPWRSSRSAWGRTPSRACSIVWRCGSRRCCGSWRIPAASPPRTQLADLPHELVGSAGTLGLHRAFGGCRALRGAIRRRSAAAITAEMRHEAKATLAELRNRRSLEAIAGRSECASAAADVQHPATLGQFDRLAEQRRPVPGGASR